MTLRNLALAGAVGASALAAPVAVQGANPTVAAVLAHAVAQAPCPVDVRDVVAIFAVEAPSAVLQPDGRATNADGTPIRGDGGQSYGPGQFYRPAGTWSTYGAGGDPDRLDDAAAATARMACADGYTTDRRSAIRAHNGSGPAAEAYADRVLALADEVPKSATVTDIGNLEPEASDRWHGVAGRVADATVGYVLDRWSELGQHLDDPKARSLWETVTGKVEPVVGPLEPVTALQDGNPAMPAVGGIVCPVDHPTIGDGWGAPRTGHSHQGVDLFAAEGSPVRAPFDGTVVAVVDSEALGGLGGLSVSIRRDGSNAEAYMAHNRRNLVGVGQHVTAGQQVAEVGSTGNADGGPAHVHAQWYPDGGAPSDPAPTITRACGQPLP